MYKFHCLQIPSFHKNSRDQSALSFICSALWNKIPEKKLKEQLNSTHSDIKYYLNGNGKSGFLKKNYCLHYVTVTLL